MENSSKHRAILNGSRLALYPVTICISIVADSGGFGPELNAGNGVTQLAG